MSVTNINVTFTESPTISVSFPRSLTLQAAPGAGSGDVSGPGASTDNAVVRWNGTAGTAVQNSAVTIDDNGAMSGVRAITFTDGVNTVQLGLVYNPSTGAVELGIL